MVVAMPSYESLRLRPADLETYAEIAAALDMHAVRETATALMDLVLADDCVYIDALPDPVQTELLTPLGMLCEALQDGAGDPIVIATTQVVKSSARDVLPLCPQRMRELIEALP